MKSVVWRLASRLTSWAARFACAWVGAVGCEGERTDAPARDPVEKVSQFRAGGAVLPTQQVITPAGRQVELPGMRPQAIALSPDGQLLATSGMTHDLVLVDPVSGKILHRVALPPDQRDAGEQDGSSHNHKPAKEPQLSYTGLAFSPDGARIYLSNVYGSIKVFAVSDGHVVMPVGSLALPKTGLDYQPRDIPAGLSFSQDGRKLYVCLNVSNRLLECDAATGTPVRMFDVGNAPFDVVLVGHKAYVSNWGGRRVDASEPAGPIGIGAQVRVDPVRFIANEGSVSVVDLEAGRTIKEIIVGLHASALATALDGKYVAVANANSDTVSVIDTATDDVVETISTRWQKEDLFGASPNALCFDPSGQRLYVCNGTQNSVAVVSFAPGHSKLQGLIPTGWFPGAVAFDAKRNAIDVANIKGVGSGRHIPPGEPVKYNSHQYFGTLSLAPLPDEAQLASFTRQVLDNCRHRDALAALLPPRPGTPPRPVPQRAGEPSLFRHVVYIIKENRTYDQVFGDMKEGNGDESLCVFGQRFTPNQHKLCREFVLLDNAYCNGINSAEGHQWTDSAIASDYVERSYAGFVRSYPDGMEDRDADALAYASTGFIWDTALAHGKTLRDWGEFAISTSGWNDVTRKDPPRFLDYYRDFVNRTGLTHVGSRPAIASLRNYLDRQYVGWELNIPDAVRARRFIDELHEFERAGTMANLCIVCLPNDHTSGTKAHCPTPGAMVADNDLAFGQIVEAISHSRFWKDTCILAIEDDPQNGWDHVSAFRTTAYVVSPYTKRHAVVHVNYNQPSLVRTIELILGLPPMNELDAMAAPMFDCFADAGDFTPFDAAPNQVALDQMNPQPEAIRDALQRRYAEASAALPLEEPDRCPEDLLNHVLWEAQKGSGVPYPDRYAGTHRPEAGHAADQDD